MVKELGDVVGPGDDTETITTDGTPTAGDAVAIDQSTDKKVTQTNSGDTDAGEEFAGAAVEDHGSDGDEETVVLSGRVVMNVAGTVVCGDRLDVSATDGQLAESSGGPALALCDAGGSYKGASLGSNEAVVYF
jgi:lipopolysaccharide export system protein LptA